MIDFVNSLGREELVKLGKKIKAPGYLEQFTNMNDKELKKNIIDNISDNKVKKKIKSKKSISQKKTPLNKKSAKRSIQPDIDFKIIKNKSYYPVPDGATIVAIGDLHGDYVATIKSLKLGILACGTATPIPIAVEISLSLFIPLCPLYLSSNPH